MIANLIALWVPEAYLAWVDYRRDAMTFSRMEMDLIKINLDNWLPSDALLTQHKHMTLREITEFKQKLGWTE
jgi:hypothetical protein